MNLDGPAHSKIGAIALLVALTFAQKAVAPDQSSSSMLSGTLPPLPPTPIGEFFSGNNNPGLSIVTEENIAYTTLQVEPYEVPPGILTNPIFFDAKNSLIEAFQKKINSSTSAIEKISLAYNLVADWHRLLKSHPDHQLQQYANSFANPLLHALLAGESSPQSQSALVSCVFHSRITHYWVRVNLSDNAGNFTVFDLDPTEYDSPTMLFPRGIPGLGPFGAQQAESRE